MFDAFEIRQNLVAMREVIKVAGESFDIDRLNARILELKEVQNTDAFWSDMEKAGAVSKELKAAENKLERLKRLSASVDDCEALLSLIEEFNDESEIETLNAEISALNVTIEQLRLEALLRGKYDGLNAILTLHAGAGGTEAQDWVSMLFRMYSRYIERKDWELSVLDCLDGDEAGLKSVTFRASGENAYGYLKAEKGVHRLVRISPFDSNKRRHTSFASLEVMPEITDTAEIVINSDDLKVDTYRSSGAGGQHVNKTESAIRITHIPSGIIVACQNERSQMQNREVAMRMLMGRLIEKRERERMEQEQSIQGELKKIEWGSQIRSYVFCPYTMVKDHRTGYEIGNVQAVMDGDIDGFVVEYLKKS
ncbi:MAG: peptide chain release factor 2 [Clostridiaceae bacterium]|jgi:peptide chain release factor 2|nr:peptide chain release factor 2 [Clostridiaceae bacterium]